MRIIPKYRIPYSGGAGAIVGAEGVLSYIILVGTIWYASAAPLSTDVAASESVETVSYVGVSPLQRTLWLSHRHRRKRDDSFHGDSRGLPQGRGSPAFHSYLQSSSAAVSSATNVGNPVARGRSGTVGRGSVNNGRGRDMVVADTQNSRRHIKKKAGSASGRRGPNAFSSLADLTTSQIHGKTASSLPFLSSIPPSSAGSYPAANSEADDQSISNPPAISSDNSESDGEGYESGSVDADADGDNPLENTSLISSRTHDVSERSSEDEDQDGVTGVTGAMTHRTTRSVPREGRMHVFSVDEFERMVDSECDNAPDDIEVKVEGDIMLNKEEACDYVEHSIPFYKKKKKKRRKKRKITPVASKRWDIRVPIPYMFDGSHNGPEQEEIRSAVRHWESLTCVRFQEHHQYTQQKIVIFKKLDGCWSYVGRTSVLNQTISIGAGCDGIGTIAHEIGHVLGFWHEQSRMDRSKFIRVYIDHVKSQKKINFRDRSWEVITSMNTPYDPGSALHYGGKYFNVDGQFTIRTKDPLQQKVIGQRQDLSFYDVKLANLAYCNVTDKTSDGYACNRDGYTDPKRPSQCRCPDGFSGKTCDTVAPSDSGCGNGLLYSERGYISYYRPGGLPSNQQTKCNWLIRVPRGKIIVLEILNINVTWDSEKWLCQDYVEARYRTHLSETGGRFCGSTLPSSPVYSYGNEMLLLFRTFKGGGNGFTAKYRTESCGGCADRNREEQRPCYQKATEHCEEAWEEEEYVKCADLFAEVGAPCGARKVRKKRNMMCHVDKPHCCHGYVLQEHHGVKKCVAERPARAIQDNPFPDSVTMPTLGLGHPTPKLGGNFESSDERTTWPWSSWSDWVCSKPTCGCGTATRTRRCLQPGHTSCGGQQSQTERRACSNKPCICTVKSPTYYPCPGSHYFGRTSMCVGYTTKKKVCPEKAQQCCPGQSQIGSVCSPWK